MKKQYYRQCKFKSENKEHTGWIPEYGAKLGHSMIFDDDPKERWTVISVGSVRLLKEDLKKSDVFESIKPKESK